jgi:hypothetical protein
LFLSLKFFFLDTEDLSVEEIFLVGGGGGGSGGGGGGGGGILGSQLLIGSPLH